MKHHSTEGGKNREILDSPEKRRQFFISIFGTGSEKTDADKAAIKDAKAVAENLVESGFSIATGGYGGVMKAASEAALAKAEELGDNPQERVRAYTLDSDKMKDKEVKGVQFVRSGSLPERLSHLINESSAFVVAGGGLGTTVEILTALEGQRINQAAGLGEAAKPLIIIDESLKQTDLIAALAQKEKKLNEPAILENTFILSHEPKAAEISKEIIEMYYQSAQGREAEEKIKTELSRYSLDNFLSSRQNFEAGGGI